MSNMQFSIPDTQEVYADLSASTYTVYNIYINGLFHCSLRFKQLHALDDQLRRRCAELGVHLPQFPPKRLLPLSKAQLETRRAALEHYLQRIVQDKRIVKMDYFQQYLLRAQFETALTDGSIDTSDLSCKMDIMLPNSCQLQVNCRVNQNSNAILQYVCRTLQIPEQFQSYFSIYLARRDNDGTLVLLRWLMNFESPYISCIYAQPCKLIIRKNYWDPEIDMKIYTDANALNLLYLQTIGDIAEDWIIASLDVREQLRSLQDNGLKKQYMEIARHLPLYGCVQFQNALIDYPEPDTTATVSIGNKELSIRTPNGNKIYETKFRVTRMRCWRVSAMHNTRGSRECPTELQISFEYLMSHQTLRWITITSPQAMLMSVCLQSLVDDLLATDNVKSAEETHLASTSGLNGGGRASNSSTPTSAEQSYMSINSSASTSSAESNTKQQRSSTVKFLAEVLPPTSKKQNKLLNPSTFSAVFFRNNVHNEVFGGIGNDDL